jgi:hypothetical protein
MPYPESCPECSSTFRNTGTHFTARRNEVGRHVLLELGCQTTNRRFWWNFTTGQLAGVTTTETRSSLTSTADARVLATACAASNGASASNGHASTPRASSSPSQAVNGSPSQAVTGSNGSNGTNGHSVLAAVPLAQPTASEEKPAVQSAATPPRPSSSAGSNPSPAPAPILSPEAVPQDTSAIREAFLRQLQLDRLTMRQMRGWLMADEARRAAEVAGSATEATYERLALALFGVDLPQLLGRAAAVPPSTAMSAEERLELQREKARIRARQRRAAIKAARLAKED